MELLQIVSILYVAGVFAYIWLVFIMGIIGGILQRIWNGIDQFMRDMFLAQCGFMYRTLCGLATINLDIATRIHWF